ncbi:MAG: ABC transporter permease [Thermoplasmata archaeon]|nr:ABC transporter permease [Thermoplasmata archaeon]
MSASPAPAAKPTGRRPNPTIAQWRRTFYFLRRNKLAMIGLGILVLLVFVAIASLFYTSQPSDYLQPYQGTFTGNGFNATPSPGIITICTYASTAPVPGPNCYPVNTLFPGVIPPTFSVSPWTLGRLPLGSLSLTPGNNQFFNLFEGLVKAAPWDLGISAVVAVSGASIGLFLGALAGYLGGVMDDIVMRVVDVFLTIPSLLLLIVILAVTGSIPSLASFDARLGILFFAFIITDWPGYARQVRGLALVTREQKYVEAAKASGAKTGHILRKHIIPNTMFPVLVGIAFDIASTPLALGALVFLGFKTIFPTQYFPEWGSIAAFGAQSVGTFIQYCEVAASADCVFPWWQVLLPGMAVFLLAISVNFLSDGMRDALDPRLRR